MVDFGQFITHGSIQTPDMAGSGPDPCDCARTDVCDNIFHTRAALGRTDPVIQFFGCTFIVKSVGTLEARSDLFD